MKANDEASGSAMTNIERRRPGGRPSPSGAIAVAVTNGGRDSNG